MNRRVAVLFLTLFLTVAACGGGDKTVSQEPDGPRVKAAEFDRKARKAYKNEDYELAYQYYREALRINRSIENYPSMAIQVVNTAAALRALGRTDDARNLLEGMLSTKHIVMADETRIEALYLLGLLALDISDGEKALTYASKGIETCRAGKCSSEGRLHNLEARAFLMSGRSGEALAAAEKAAQENRKDGNRTEEANALRLMARASEDSGDLEAASGFYTRALEIDKAEALGAKIYHDLMGLGRTSEGMGQNEKALEYFRRAYSVAEALEADKYSERALERLLMLQQGASP